MGQTNFLHVDIDIQKLKVDQKSFGWACGHGQKWVWPVWSWDSKIDCISEIN